MKKTCDYEDCDKKVFCTEGLTGMYGKLCEEHAMRLFGKLFANAKFIDEDGKEHDTN